MKKHLFSLALLLSVGSAWAMDEKINERCEVQKKIVKLLDGHDDDKWRILEQVKNHVHEQDAQMVVSEIAKDRYKSVTLVSCLREAKSQIPTSYTLHLDLGGNLGVNGLQIVAPPPFVESECGKILKNFAHYGKHLVNVGIFAYAWLADSSVLTWLSVIGELSAVGTDVIAGFGRYDSLIARLSSIEPNKNK